MVDTLTGYVQAVVSPELGAVCVPVRAKSTRQEYPPTSDA